jgi:hypothetical protein
MPQALPLRKLRWKDRRGSVWGRILALVSVVASIIGVATFAWTYYPTVEIKATEVADKIDPINAEFTINNIGKLPVYELIFTCLIDTPGRLVELGGNKTDSPLGSTGGQGMPYLAASGSITRNCALGFRKSYIRSRITYPAYHSRCCRVFVAIHWTAEFDLSHFQQQNDAGRRHCFGTRLGVVGWSAFCETQMSILPGLSIYPDRAS